ncbi:MAG: FecR family protein [Agriterribacter sp.]
MHTHHNRLTELFKKFTNNTLSPAEYEELWNLLPEGELPAELFAELNCLWQESAIDQIELPGAEWDDKLGKLREEFLQQGEKTNITDSGILKYIHRYKWMAAAVLTGVVSALGFLRLNQPSAIRAEQSLVVTPKMSDVVQPGGNKAVLQLANGSFITLDSAANGLLAQQGSTRIVKQRNGELKYAGNGAAGGETTYNKLITPRGGQYHLVLPDGSKVWLNAASSIRYPTTFATERNVEITGEAYFEIAHNAAKPFTVQIISASDPDTGSVTVLGTHFNINAYPDEKAVKTTLLEGSVKLAKGQSNTTLQQGQQASFNQKGVFGLNNKIDVEETVAWKNGSFLFSSQHIQDIMRQISRWYDVDVVYAGKITEEKFSGVISRSSCIEDVLKIMEAGGVQFRLDQKTLMVQMKP